MRVATVLIAFVVAILGGIVLQSQASASRLTLDTELQELKAATSRYHSLEQAEKAGYVADPHCAFSPTGGMGYHYVNQALVADPTLDPLRPEILVYAPTENGKLELVAVEYLIAAAATGGSRPSLFGQPFDGPMPGHSPGQPVHYDLHVWLYKANPSGMFAPFNPDVVCLTQ